MFEQAPVEAVLAVESRHDFGLPDTAAEFGMGASRIDALGALNRVARTTRARVYRQIIALVDDRDAMDPDWRLRLGEPSLATEVGLVLELTTGVADRLVTGALTLRHLPRVLAVLERGEVGERSIEAVCEVLASTDDLALLADVDARLATRLPGLTPGRARRLTQRILLAADPEAAAERARRARETGPGVFLEPLEDGLAFLGITGAAEQLTALHHELLRHTGSQKAAGDPRRRGRIMVETLVERGTGQAHADAPAVELQILMRDTTLRGLDDHPAELVGYGPLDPTTADSVIGRADRTWWRRIYTDPRGHVTDRDPRRRRFTGSDAGFLATRDRTCRRPGCDCRAAHLDHIRRHADHGDTVIENGQGLCARDNQAKEGRGWSVTLDPLDGTTIIWTTPTGHHYESPPEPIDPPLNHDHYADTDHREHPSRRELRLLDTG